MFQTLYNNIMEMEIKIKIAIEYLSKSIEAIETLKSEKDEGAM